MSTNTKVLLSFFACCIFLAGVQEVSAVTETGTTCHTITNKSMVTSTKYGSPINLFDNIISEPMMRVRCDGSESATAYVKNELSTQYIYKYGHKKVDGSWEKAVFTGDKVVGPWVIGTATTELDGVEKGQTGQVLAYICQKVNGRWKCGCGDEACRSAKWQQQKYQYQAWDNESEGEWSGEENEQQENTGTGLDFVEFMNENSDDNDDYEGIDLYFPSKHYGLPGDTITLNGKGFEYTNSTDVLWNGEEAQSNLSSKTGTTLSIQVPDLTPGKYEVNVREGNEKSEFGTVIWIGDENSTVVPHIESISPSMVEQGDSVTVSGSGFADKNNDVITSFKRFLEVPSTSDGKIIKIDYNLYDEKLVRYDLNGKEKQYEEEVTVTVINIHGISEPYSWKHKI